MYRRLLCLFAIVWGSLLAAPAQADLWAELTPAGEVELNLYFFWTEQCPHCKTARPQMDALDRELPWLRLHSLRVDNDRSNQRLFAEMAGLFGESPSSVPAFFYCGMMQSGFGPGTQAQIRSLLNECRENIETGVAQFEREQTRQQLDDELAGLGLDARDYSLPLLTVVIAGLDAFNPCAFFVLLFLLSLIAHLRNRARMALIGGVFVFFSGAIYFLFMAAWLNVFLVMGQVRMITAIAGAIAVGLALFNLKDYLYLGRGPSLSIPESAKPGLFQRMRGLLQTDNLPALLLGTSALAIAVNSYEILCTAGLPMVYTRILTLEALPVSTYYLYLLFYNFIYILPLLAIVAVFTWTLGSRKLQEREGRLLKLLSGLIMLGLGAILLIDPALLNRLGTSLLLMGGAVGLTLVAYLVERRHARR